MYCKFCGSQLDAGTSVCSACGRELGKPAEKISESAVSEPVYVAEGPAGAEAAPVKEKAKILPAVLMGAFLLVWNFVSVLLGFNFRALGVYIEHGMMEAVVSQLTSFGISAAFTLAQAFIGAVIVLVIILVRKRHLSSVTYKDLVVFALFTVSIYVFGRIGGIFDGALMSRFGTSYAAATGTATAILNIVACSTLLSWICLGIFLLARSGAKVLSPILAGCVWLICALAGICVAVFTATLVRLFNTSPVIVDQAVLAVRVGALGVIVISAVKLLFFWSWGSGKMGFVPAIIYGPVQGLINLLLGYTVTWLFAFELHLGSVAFGLGEPIGWLVGGLYPLVFTVIGIIRQAKKRKKLEA